MWLKRSILFAFVALLNSYDALAQENSKTYLSLSVENDSLGGRTDRYYTSGVRATWFNTNIDVPPLIEALANKIPTFDLNERTSAFYTLGHNLYTPENITLENPQKGDRPWAAFLYGSIGLANITYNDSLPFHIDELEFALGFIGPEALGKPTQRFVHKYISNSPSPRGWKNQLNFEPGIVISWQRRIPYALTYDSKHFHARIEPNFSVSLGNIRTNAGAGTTLVIGSSKEQDTPQRVRPAIPGTGVFFTKENKLDWQIFAGVDGRLVARDIFLDGNTFTDNHSVDKRYLVGDVSIGTSITYNDFRLSYTLNARSKEFNRQQEESIFGSITLTKRF